MNYQPVSENFHVGKRRTRVSTYGPSGKRLDAPPLVLVQPPEEETCKTCGGTGWEEDPSDTTGATFKCQKCKGKGTL